MLVRERFESPVWVAEERTEEGKITMDGAAEEKHDLEVPSYFKCLISMQMMTDPVVLSTGVTYDRESIEKWLYVWGKDTCPATMQRLHNRDLTPNHALRRLIQGWCAANTSTAIHPISTPIDSSEVRKLLQQVLHSPPFQVINALTKLRGLVGHSETNRRCIAAAGASDVLVSVVETFSLEIDEGMCCSFDGSRACEEALAILHRLLCNPAPHMADDDDYEKLAYNCKCVKSMAWILKRGTSQARFHAAMLFHNIVITRTANQEFLTKASDDDLLEGLLGLLTEEVCHKATVSALEILMAICRSSRRNRIKVIEAGAVHVLIRSLSETQIRSSCENMLGLLDVFCDCAEGRAAVIEHAMGIAVVSIRILMVSDVATEKAVQILWSLCKFNPSPFVLQEMVQVGGVSKLCMLLQFGCTSESKHRAKQVLRLSERLWRKSPCIPLYLLGNYPSDH